MEKNLLLFLVITVYFELVAGQCPATVPRAQWGARRPKATESLNTNPPTHVIIHHTSGFSCSNRANCNQRVRQIQNQHMDGNKWDDIGYNFLIGGDGSIYEGRGWGKKGAHSIPFNGRSIGIAYIGNFALWLPTAAAQRAGKNLISCGISRGYIAKKFKFGGHRQAKDTNTKCPGLMFYFLIQNWPHYASNL